jgi:hypothetical protein
MIDACISTLMQGRLFERDIYTEKFISAADAQQVQPAVQDLRPDGANHYTITIDDTGESYRCADDRSVLAGMEALGKKGILGCRQRRLRRVQGAGARGQLHQARDEPRHIMREEGRATGCVLSSSHQRPAHPGGGHHEETVCRPATPTGAFPFPT